MASIATAVATPATVARAAAVRKTGFSSTSPVLGEWISDTWRQMIGCARMRGIVGTRRPPISSGRLSPGAVTATHCSSQSPRRRKRRDLSMASVAAAVATPTVARAAAVRKAATTGFPSSPVLGLPQFGVRGGRVRCSASEKRPATVVPATLLAAAVSTMSMSNQAALALVDERMSTEGTGLSLGLSNNVLGWILFGVFGLIWALYFVYTSTLDEDEESGGLSL